MQQSARRHLTYNSWDVDESVLEFTHSVDDGAHGLGATCDQRVEVLDRLIFQKSSIPAVQKSRRRRTNQRPLGRRHRD